MTTLDRTRAATSRRPRRRLVAMAAATAVAASALVGLGASPTAATTNAVTDATFEWGVSPEIGQWNPPFGGCNFLSAGESDGTQATYRTSEGNVTVLKDGVAPTWAGKCSGATTGTLNQKLVWSGGTGTVDPDTGEATLAFEGTVSIGFYGGLVPFSIQDPVITVDAAGDGQMVATLFGYASSMDNPDVKEPTGIVEDVVVADLSGVTVGASGFTVTPDYAGVEYEPPAGSGGTPQNRSTPGWGSWPASFVDYHYITGLTSYWYHSGGGADPKKAPTAITVTYTTDGSEEPPPEPGDGEQTIIATVPEDTGPGEFLWSIDGDRSVDLGTTTDQGTYLQATGAIDPITVTDTRTGGPQWSISGQVSDFTGGLSGSHLGWDPTVIAAGAGAVPGAPVASGLGGGDGLSVPSILAAAANGHGLGTATLGAGLDLRLPVETAPGAYTATLTITALS